MGKEPERSEQVEHCIEATRPPRGQRTHVATRIAKLGTGAASPRYSQKLLRIVQAIYVKSRFSEEVSVTTLPAWNVEDAGTCRQAEEIDDARNFSAIPFGREKRSVLEEIVSVECRLPPL